MFSPYQDTALNYLEGLGLMVSMMTLYLGIWTFSASGASQIFISVLIIILNGVWLLCVSGVLFASFGNKVKRVFAWIGDKACMREKGGSDGHHHESAFPSLDGEVEMGSITRQQGNSIKNKKKTKDEMKGETLIVNPFYK